MKDGFHKEEGPFVKALDNALSAFHVQRQAYYSGTFVGNHVHRSLKVVNILFFLIALLILHIHSLKLSDNLAKLCHSVVEVAEKHCPTVLSQAKVIEEKYKKIISRATMASQSQTQRLSNWVNHPLQYFVLLQLSLCFVGLSDMKIKEFMTCYRNSFAWATVIPKMHMLEEHVIPWLKMWHIGFGLMGEQGAESIHAYFNGLKRTFHSTPDPVLRLRRMMNEHLLHIAPSNVAAKPESRKKKRKMSSDS